MRAFCAFGVETESSSEERLGHTRESGGVEGAAAPVVDRQQGGEDEARVGLGLSFK